MHEVTAAASDVARAIVGFFLGLAGLGILALCAGSVLYVFYIVAVYAQAVL